MTDYMNVCLSLFLGECDCDTGHVGRSCSTDLSKPATVKYIANSDVCDTSQEDCFSFVVTLVGETFDSPGILCQIEYVSFSNIVLVCCMKINEQNNYNSNKYCCLKQFLVTT